MFGSVTIRADVDIDDVLEGIDIYDIVKFYGNDLVDYIAKNNELYKKQDLSVEELIYTIKCILDPHTPMDKERIKKLICDYIDFNFNETIV